MSEQANNNGQQPQPQSVNPQTIIMIQQQEINRVNDNRIYLMSLIEEIKAEAQAEIRRLLEEIALLKEDKVEQE